MKNFPSFQKLGRKIISPLAEFIQDSRSIGIILLVSAFFSILLSNSPWKLPYLSIWNQNLLPYVFHQILPITFLQWINKGLMTIFFFWVGLEIKRELWVGELSSLKKSLLPILAACGGMLGPALIFLTLNFSTPFEHGWGIPMATDIAFSLGILSILGNRIPRTLKIFLMALAIIDDLGAILVIAIFYSHHFQMIFLLIGIGIMGFLILLNFFRVQNSIPFLLGGLLLWYSFLHTGIHPTIAGVFLAFSFPISMIDAMENFLQRVVNFFILPLFALANTAIPLPNHLLLGLTSSLSQGIIWGLVIGKPLGIMLTSFFATRMNWVVLPSDVSWRQFFGASILAGIGFTMSIFISTLAFSTTHFQNISKISVLGASFLAGTIGFFLLRFGKLIKKE
ncbi:MAG: Na+/H+ antiporter NhaA [Chitinophagaceae bacterium]